MTWSLNTTLCLYREVPNTLRRMEAVEKDRKTWLFGLEMEKPGWMKKVLSWTTSLHLGHSLDSGNVLEIWIWCIVCTRQVISKYLSWTQSNYYSNTGRKQVYFQCCPYSIISIFISIKLTTELSNRCLSWIYYLIMRCNLDIDLKGWPPLLVSEPSWIVTRL